MEWNNFGAKFSLQIIFMDSQIPAFVTLNLEEFILIYSE